MAQRAEAWLTLAKRFGGSPYYGIGKINGGRLNAKKFAGWQSTGLQSTT
jgi:hypothetical protein